MRDVDLPRVLTAPAAATLGVTESKIATAVRRGRWRRLASCVVLTRPDDPLRDDWAMAGLWLGGAAAALSGWDAIALRGVVAHRTLTGPVLVLTDHGRVRQVGGVHLRPTRRRYACWQTSVDDPTLPGARVVGPARAVADAAIGCRDLDRVRAAVASTVQRQVCTVQDLTEELARGPRNGSALLRQALGEAMDGSRSVAEARAARRLHRAGLGPFQQNAPVNRPTGEPAYLADFLWPAAKAVLEIDSREFHFSERDWKATMRRHNDLTSWGYSVTHYPPSAIDGPGWPGEVRKWLFARQRDLAVGGLHAAVRPS